MIGIDFAKRCSENTAGYLSWVWTGLPALHGNRWSNHGWAPRLWQPCWGN